MGTVRLYDAERKAFADSGLGGQTFADDAEIQRYVDKVVRSKYFRTHCLGLDRSHTVTKILVEPFDGKATANGGGYLVKWRGKWVDRIQVGSEARVAWVVLHEIAHCVVPDRVNGRREVHGRLFTSVYIGLVQRFLGREAAKALREECRNLGIKTRRRTAA